MLHCTENELKVFCLAFNVLHNSTLTPSPHLYTVLPSSSKPHGSYHFPNTSCTIIFNELLCSLLPHQGSLPICVLQCIVHNTEPTFSKNPSKIPQTKMAPSLPSTLTALDTFVNALRIPWLLFQLLLLSRFSRVRLCATS